MFITRIRVHDTHNSSTFDAVLRELSDLCDSFTCYPKEQMFIIPNKDPHDIIDSLRARNINTDNVVGIML